MGLRFSKLNNSIATFKVINTAVDPDAQAFIDATGISGTNASAINTLVVDLKGASIWTKMKALYPFVGGTATTHKFNLKNPVDSNAAFRLAFFGGGTHSSNGYQPGGVNGYANTFLNSSTTLTLNTTHLSYYSRTSNSNPTSYDMGYFQNPNLLGLSCGYQGTAYSDHYNYTSGRVSVGNLSALGFYIGSRTTSAIHKLFKNGSQIGTTNTGAAGSFTSLDLYIGAYNASGTAGTLSSKECAFASIGDGLSDAEALSFYNAVQTFNTTLGRQV